jgi:3-methyl-2-oxobutanoate hydroxymethyltransferase
MSVTRFVAAKKSARKLSMLTAYDYYWAQIFDEAGVDSLLVGDSMGMVVQGHSSTVPVTLDQIIYHAEIVCRAVKHALVVVDLPFGTYHISPEQALESAGRIIKETGANAVMAHVGMRPQSVNALGGHGRIQRDSDRLLADAKAAEDAGAFAIVIELVPRQIAARITNELDIPTIGIGAGPECDGQVLVMHDVLGLTPKSFSPKFLKRYADLRGVAESAVRGFVEEVQTGVFPDDAHSHS